MEFLLFTRGHPSDCKKFAYIAAQYRVYAIILLGLLSTSYTCMALRRYKQYDWEERREVDEEHEYAPKPDPIIR